VTYTVSITDERGHVVRRFTGIPWSALRHVLGILDEGIGFLSTVAQVVRSARAITGAAAQPPRRLT
jgi:hypothetical protein